MGEESWGEGTLFSNGSTIVIITTIITCKCAGR